MSVRIPVVLPGLAAVLLLAAAVPAEAQPPGFRGANSSSVAIAAAISDRDRPQSDRAQDARRKPVELIAFSGVTRRKKVADVLPGDGYFTRLFSNVTGQGGRVYAIVPPGAEKRFPDKVKTLETTAASPEFSNVTIVRQSPTSFRVPEPLDVVWTSLNYHDLYYGQGEQAALDFDKSAFAALHPGGTFIVVDHVALPGASGNVAALHRIDPQIIIRQAQAAGFTLESRSDVLANPSDPHDKPVFDPSIRGRTDQVVLKFRRPA
ncbi:methyltransferase [Acetobacter sp. AN02]|uniref:class I SAM-dependent methyltransferase n=1 Tax=Acetobacter sp. AN02 TaxID=2894186 RepID=UPI0024345B1F|nr:methyltransferase [Acetobacter sp. AN02]MDG6095002.1 methyltransferase [Acetobacter sp. AN02]